MRANAPLILFNPIGPAVDAPFVLALIGAIWLHLALLLAVSFAWPRVQPPPESSMEVLLLKDWGAIEPNHNVEAALAQRDQAGESARGDAAISAFGDASQDQAQTPRTEGPSPAAASSLAPKRVDESLSPPRYPDRPLPLDQPPTSLLSAAAASSPAPTLKSQPQAVDAARILASQGLEVARLTSPQSLGPGSKRQRRRAVSASTREFRYASYLDVWAKKVERIGNLNYPQAAREQGLYGSLVLHVAVRKDGSVEGIRVVRSSGIELLDQAAIQIVELAAPFAPFPPDIAAETDVLDIVRTWQFMRGDVLGWEP